MPVELGKFIHSQLDVLPENHPDRQFLQGLALTIDSRNQTGPEHAIDVDPDNLATDTEITNRLDAKIFLVQLNSSGVGFGYKAIRRAYRDGTIGRLEDFSRLPDKAILKIEGIGPVTLKWIRGQFEFVESSS